MAIQIKKIYKGFSTRNYEESGGTLDIYNVAVVEEDLLNEIFTMLGERIDLPDFGTRIPELPFEMNDAQTASILREDLLKVINNEPRVKLEALDLMQAENQYAMIAVAKLTYLEFNVTKELRIVINGR